MHEIDLIIPFHRPIDSYLLGAIESAQNSAGVLVNLLLINDRAENSDSSRALRKMGHRVIDSEKVGDYIYTGTPSGVGPVSSGDKLVGFIETEEMFRFNIG